MKKAKLIFIFKQEINGVKSRIINIQYTNFSDLTSKVKSYKDNGVIVTFKKVEAALYGGMNKYFDKDVNFTTYGVYIPSEEIAKVLVQFIYNPKGND